MLGFGLSLPGGLLRRRGAGISSPVPTPTPTPAPTLAYLPALTTAGAAYHAVHSNERLIAGYTGGLLSAGADFGTGQTGVSAADVQAARGDSDALRVAGWYDQSGNGRHAIAATGGERPALRQDVLIGDALAMAFDGIRLGDGRGPQPRRVTATTAMAAGDCTLAYVIDPTVSIQEQYYFQLRDGAGTGTALGHLQYPGAQFGGALPDVHGNIAINGAGIGLGRDGGRKIATVPQVVVLRSAAAGLDLFLDGVKIAGFGPLSGTTGSLSIGAFASGEDLAAYIPTFRLGAFVAIDKGVSDADVTAIATALMTRFAIPGSYDAVVVNIGSSRVAGMSQSTATRTKAWFERAHYGTRRIKTYNLAQDGKAISGCYADRAAFDFELYDAARPTVYVIDDPINDLGGLGASTDPAAIYATYTSYCNALAARGANVGVVLATCLPQASGGYAGLTGRSDAAIDADRVTLNAAIRTNAAGADAVSDPAASAAMGVYPDSANDAARYADHLHPSSYGYSLLAAFNPTATNALLP